MTDHLSPDRRSGNLRAVRWKDSKHEMAVRLLLHALGYRYRLHRKDLPGKPDLAFQGRRKAIFVHGCFWHGHDCPRGARPTTNRAFWNAKLAANAERDARQMQALADQGWTALVIWECEVGEGLACKLVDFLGPPGLGLKAT